MREITCINCGKKKMVKAWNARTCSNGCSVRAWRKNNPEHYHQIRVNQRRRRGIPTKGSIEHAEKVRKSLKGKSAVGDKHINWKGEKASYRTLHLWVQRHKGKASYCEIDSSHVSTRYHWANISGEYKRDLNDWRQTCPSCNRNDGVRMAKRFQKARVATL